MNTLLRMFVPCRCVACGKLLDISGKDGFCASCSKYAIRISEMKFSTGSISVVRAAFSYSGTVAYTLRRLKRRDDGGTSDFFAGEMSDIISGDKDLCEADVIACVPRYGKGYNQTYSLAVRISRITGIPFDPKLIRKNADIMSQTKCSSPNERRENVKGAYGINPERSVSGIKVIVIDDIFTTGSTLSECGQALKNGGAADVFAVVAAHGLHGSEADADSPHKMDIKDDVMSFCYEDTEMSLSEFKTAEKNYRKLR